MSKDGTCYRFVNLTSAYVQILSSTAADPSEISKGGNNALGIQRQVPRCEGARQLNRQPRKVNSSSFIHTQSKLHFSFNNPQTETMVHIFTRNLTFQSNNLGKEVTLMLTFDGDMKSLYEDFFPVVWKATTFGKSGSYMAQATYTSQLAFSKPQVVDEDIIDASTCVKINVSEKTSLTEANEVYHFSSPVAGVNGVLQAVNNTDAIQDIAVGLWP
ncbi:hypothetical protein CY34DRAFT_814007, partial [Suillus luteus UH-Slu-Lm8-n1]